MVVNTSAIVAIAIDEPEAPSFEQCIADDPVRLISAATVLEAAMVIETRLGEPRGSELDLWLHKAGFELLAVEPEHADQARRAWPRYGKGAIPPTLILEIASPCTRRADRRAIALQGNDFSQTDIPTA